MSENRVNREMGADNRPHFIDYDRPSDEALRRDEIGSGLSVWQLREGHLFGTDALLLSNFIIGDHAPSKGLAAELGGGSGAVSLLCARAELFRKIYCVEIQEAYCSLIRRNAAENRLGGRVAAVRGDFCEPENLRDDSGASLPLGTLDAVFSNPPYIKIGGGLPAPNAYKDLARREVACTVREVSLSASRLLREGGDFYCVWRPERLASLMAALSEARLEPKRMVCVHPREGAPACLLLVKAKKGAGEQLTLDPPIMLDNRS